MNIVLIGFRGTGKSTVGKLLASRLKRDFVDTDVYIEKNTGRTIKEVFAQEGEEGFRKIESDNIEVISKMENMVIAAGGGVVLKSENIRNLKSNGYLILLEATPEVIYERINQDEKTAQQRPALTNKKPYEEIKHLITKRLKLYENAVDYRIDTSYITCEEIVEKIVTALESKIT